MAARFTTSIRKKIGLRLKRARKRAGLEQVQVADLADINPSFYSKIERGEVNFSLAKFYKIVKALKLKSSDILPF